MKTITKTYLEDNEIKELIGFHFGKVHCSYELIDTGLYNTTYRINVNNQDYLLKIAPKSEVDVLTYEQDIIKNEIILYEKLNNSQLNFIPKLLFHNLNRNIIDNDYIITEFINANTLLDNWDNKDIEMIKKKIYEDLMIKMALIHNAKTSHFGYNHQQPESNYFDTLKRMFIDVLNDAENKDVILGYKKLDIITVLNNYQHLFINVEEVSYLHFDLWDGNILINDNQILSLIDLERGFNGEKIADFVPLMFDIFEDENRYLIDIYNQYSNEEIVLDDITKNKYLIYKMYLRLIMITECKYREVNGSFNDQYYWAKDELDKIMKELIVKTPII